MMLYLNTGLLTFIFLGSYFLQDRNRKALRILAPFMLAYNALVYFLFVKGLFPWAYSLEYDKASTYYYTIGIIASLFYGSAALNDYIIFHKLDRSPTEYIEKLMFACILFVSVNITWLALYMLNLYTIIHINLGAYTLCCAVVYLYILVVTTKQARRDHVRSDNVVDNSHSLFWPDFKQDGVALPFFKKGARD